MAPTKRNGWWLFLHFFSPSFPSPSFSSWSSSPSSWPSSPPSSSLAAPRPAPPPCPLFLGVEAEMAMTETHIRCVGRIGGKCRSRPWPLACRQRHQDTPAPAHRPRTDTGSRTRPALETRRWAEDREQRHTNEKKTDTKTNGRRDARDAATTPFGQVPTSSTRARVPHFDCHSGQSLAAMSGIDAEAAGERNDKASRWWWLERRGKIRCFSAYGQSLRCQGGVHLSSGGRWWWRLQEGDSLFLLRLENPSTLTIFEFRAVQRVRRGSGMSPSRANGAVPRSAWPVPLYFSIFSLSLLFPLSYLPTPTESLLDPVSSDRRPFQKRSVARRNGSTHSFSLLLSLLLLLPTSSSSSSLSSSLLRKNRERFHARAHSSRIERDALKDVACGDNAGLLLLESHCPGRTDRSKLRCCFCFFLFFFGRGGLFFPVKVPDDRVVTLVSSAPFPRASNSGRKKKLDAIRREVFVCLGHVVGEFGGERWNANRSQKTRRGERKERSSFFCAAASFFVVVVVVVVVVAVAEKWERKE